MFSVVTYVRKLCPACCGFVSRSETTTLRDDYTGFVSRSETTTLRDDYTDYLACGSAAIC